MTTLTIRRECRREQEAVRRVHQDAFGGTLEANLVDALRAGGFAEVSLVAVADGAVVAHVLFSPVVLQTAAGGVAGLSLAPMAVRGSHQGRGLGSRLVEAGLAAGRRRGHRFVVVLGHPGYYPRFGFSAEQAARLESPFGGGDAWMALELAPGALAGVAGRVQYAPPLQRLA